MKYYYILFLILVTTIFAQSLSDLNRLSNSQLDMLRQELQSEKPTSNEIKDIAATTSKVQISPKIVNTENNFFGYEYFTKNINFFDNTPTPSDYKLGPGDEIILSLWGATNSRERFLINKDGLIYYKNIGLINLSNLTLSEAENLMSEQLSKIYSTLDDGPSNLMIELGQLKSINVFFSGEIQNPGINLIHPFSDVFTAIIQAGGVKNSGSLRNVQIIRSGEIIQTVDFYSFFIAGENKFSKIKLLDGDIIHIPIVKNRIKINGEVGRNKLFYEILRTDTINDMISFAGGLKSTASTKLIVNNILPPEQRESDDSARFNQLIDLNDADKLSLHNGAILTILPIAKNETNVTVYGRVTLPGSYPAKITSDKNNEKVHSSVTLKEVLDLAGGFEDVIFRKSISDDIIVLRLDENKFYSSEFKVNYKDAASFSLEVNDKIFVYQNSNYKNSFTFNINGEVNRPGTYPLYEGLTLDKAINLAGGITENGSINNISVSKELVRIDKDGNEVTEVELVRNINLNFKIADRNIISILPKTNVVRVDGNVYNPGLIAHQLDDNMTMSKAIELAGGYKPNSMKKRAYITRANGEIEKANIFRGRAKRVFPGDSIFVPVDPNPDKFDITSFIADLTSTLANIAAILVIVDNN